MSFKKLEREEQFDELGCIAHGCPMKWSVDAGDGKLCSYHAFEKPENWPRITDKLRMEGAWVLSRHVEHGMANEYRGDPKGWARRIIDRSEAGQKVNPTSLDMAKRALGMAT